MMYMQIEGFQQQNDMATDENGNPNYMFGFSASKENAGLFFDKVNSFVLDMNLNAGKISIRKVPEIFFDGEYLRFFTRFACDEQEVLELFKNFSVAEGYQMKAVDALG